MKLVCPICKDVLLQNKDSYFCSNCSQEWSIENEIPNFAENSSYWGEIPQDEMRRVNEIAVGVGWKKSLEIIVRPKYPNMYNYITDSSRADWHFLLPMNSSSIILDIGSGWGSLSFLLSNIYSRVYSVECVKERIEFQHVRNLQEERNNITTIQGDVFNLPFQQESFNLIVMNGLLEWIGVTNKFKNPFSAQLKALQICRDLLRKDGYLYIGIENRFGYPYFFGANDHSGLRFTSLMPRWLANAYCKIRKGQLYHGISSNGYRTYTYSYWGYNKLLKKAGFSEVQVLSCLPSYNDPRYIIPINDKKLLDFFIRFLFPQNTKKRELLSFLGKFATFLGVHKIFLPCFSIIARK